jgi:hypothetical protein
VAYTPENQRKRDELKEKENERFQSWHEGQMKRIEKDNIKHKEGTGCAVLLIALPALGLLIGAAAKTLIS